MVQKNLVFPLVFSLLKNPWFLDIYILLKQFISHISLMAELLEVYDLQNNFLGVQDRKEFYKEIWAEHKETGKITRKVKTIRLFLMTSEWRIYIQERSRYKDGNPWMYDKTIWGHVTANDSFHMTMMKESVEEMWVSSVILTDQEFLQATKVVDLSVIGLLRAVAYVPNFMSVKTTLEWNWIEQPQMTTIYAGYYDGAIRFKDGECVGIRVFSMDELKEEIKRDPSKFTEDIKYMVEKYGSYLLSVKDLLEEASS